MSSAHVPKALRQRVHELARYRCGYCLTQEAVTGAPMEIEHLQPRSLGGATIEDNLWLACSLCNEHKGNRIAAEDPKDGRLVRLFNPRFDVWKDHFAWRDGGTRVVGKTAIGRVTVNALYLNRPHLVTARQAWVIAGWHPPED